MLPEPWGILGASPGMPGIPLANNPLNFGIMNMDTLVCHGVPLWYGHSHLAVGHFNSHCSSRINHSYPIMICH